MSPDDAVEFVQLAKVLDGLCAERLARTTRLPLRDFPVEAVLLVDGTTLVVASQKDDSVGVAQLQCEQQHDHFHREAATIHVVSQK
ncbi:hypothetical protein WR25_20848 [Diploscapter pachys]|uniref:Uncharacterized protein n=1 Tax=Diploscapter pachys TaxID=2018661 RepID=A0A2A2JP18_9BILA|nr:hypothetical protein WR25_20848 [Diploscapter pachys]